MFFFFPKGGLLRERKSRDVLKLLGEARGGGLDSVPQWTLRRARGEQRGSVFSVCTGGAAVLSPFLQHRGGDARLCLKRSTIESAVLEPLFEHTVVPTGEAWRGCPRGRPKLWPALDVGSRCRRGSWWPPVATQNKACFLPILS